MHRVARLHCAVVAACEENSLPRNAPPNTHRCVCVGQRQSYLTRRTATQRTPGTTADCVRFARSPRQAVRGSSRTVRCVRCYRVVEQLSPSLLHKVQLPSLAADRDVSHVNSHARRLVRQAMRDGRLRRGRHAAEREGSGTRGGARARRPTPLGEIHEKRCETSAAHAAAKAAHA